MAESKYYHAMVTILVFIVFNPVLSTPHAILMVSAQPELSATKYRNLL